MKLKYLVLLLASVVALTAGNPRKGGEKDPIPDDGFADVAEIEKWSRSSSFGGGGTQKLAVGGQDVYFTSRMVTSGRASTELVFWSQQHDGRWVPCWIMPVRMGAYTAVVFGDEVIVRKHLLGDKELVVVARMTPKFFALTDWQ
jgi:hypothetical protein